MNPIAEPPPPPSGMERRSSFWEENEKSLRESRLDPGDPELQKWNMRNYECGCIPCGVESLQLTKKRLVVKHIYGLLCLPRFCKTRSVNMLRLRDVTSFKLKSKPLSWNSYFWAFASGLFCGMIYAGSVSNPKQGDIYVITFIVALIFIIIKLFLRPMVVSVGVQGATNDPDFEFGLRSHLDGEGIEDNVRKQQAIIGESW